MLLKWYRVMAWMTGVFLLVLVFVGVPLQYFADQPAVAEIIGPIHGFLYIVYVVVAFLLGEREKWPIVRRLLVILAGTVPVMSFVAERKVTHWVDQRTEAPVPVRTSPS